MKNLACVALYCLATCSSAATFLEDMQLSANPIRKVVTLLQNMAKKVESEAKLDEALHDKYMCYCKSSGNSLSEEIQAAANKIPQTESTLGELTNSKQQLKVEIEKAHFDRQAAKDAVAKATAIREKESSAFKSYQADADSNIGALAKAIAAIDAGMSGGFLQTQNAQVLRNLLQRTDVIPESSRQEMMSFMSASQSVAYAPQSGEISGILKTIKDNMEKNLEDAIAAEASSADNFGSLIAAKRKEIATLTAAIEKKTLRDGEAAVEIASMKNDLTDTQAAFVEDKRFLADMQKNCATKAAEWDEISKTRSEEMVAIAETIKMLNDDDALELFKKTLRSASFVQMSVKFTAATSEARTMIKKANRGNLDFILLALRGEKFGFEKVITMIDNMVKTLKQEQIEDDNKKGYCNAEMDSSDDQRKSFEHDVSDLDASIAEINQQISTLVDEINAVTDELEALGKSVAEAREQREKEHSAFVDLMSSNTKAKKLIEFAINRLQKFYNPKLHILEQTELQQIKSNDRSVDALPPPPASVGPYSKKGQESNGVVSMMKLLINDLDKEMTEAETEEKDAQSDFEGAMQDASQKQTLDAKALEDKKGSKADLEAFLTDQQSSRLSAVKQLAATNKMIASLHAECDWLVKNFDVRKEARASESEALNNAKSVLSGADYSLLQTSVFRIQKVKKPEDELATEMTHDLEMNFNKIAPFGKEDTAKELQDHASKTQDTLVDAVENAEVAEIKRAVFRALTRLRAATIKEFDTIARLETQAIDAYNDAHHYRAENPLAHLHEDEAPVETDKLKSFH
jgi:predicted  nucleic acid-binding Zn-ribbon protein